MSELHPTFFAGDDYWYEQGKKLAQKTVSILRKGERLRYANILPADSMSVRHQTFQDLVQNKNVRSITDLNVSRRLPVNAGYLDAMQVDMFEQLESSPLLVPLGLLVVKEAIFRASDYKDAEQEGLSGGVYLPAARVDFVPPNAATSTATDLA